MAETNQAPRNLIGFLDFYLVEKAPFQIPAAGREWIVKYGPWITVILLAPFLPAVVMLALGLGTMMTPPLAGPVHATGLGSAAILIVANFALVILALPGLFARRLSGWNLLFYAELLFIVTSLLTGSIVGGVLGGLIGFYILFQIRTLYRA